MRPERTPFVAAHLQSVPRINSSGLSVEAARHAHLRRALQFVTVPQFSELFLEFGVRNGHSISMMANVTSSWSDRYRWDGFDSFRGLPRAEDIVAGVQRRKIGWSMGVYSTHGRLPAVPSSVSLHVGWFNESFPAFLDRQPTSRAVAFAHLDADLYESSITILHLLATTCRLRRGTVLAFDELFGSPAVEQHEWRALRDVARCFGLRFSFISFMAHERSAFGRAAVQIMDAGPACAARVRMAPATDCGYISSK